MFSRCVHYLDNKVFDIIDARCNYENHKHIVAVYGTQQFPLVSSPKETSRWEKVRQL